MPFFYYSSSLPLLRPMPRFPSLMQIHRWKELSRTAQVHVCDLHRIERYGLGQRERSHRSACLNGRYLVLLGGQGMRPLPA